ncbi:outer membrane beta-barrel protein [Kordiimonas lipolytica]|uniref:Outer membrane beta-barrel protein n=1 Tax=Kordiimonas lipolytica TaxID=1662421 RepID=A0ABV8UAS7_9PROT|nr:outer membrane beta-barrel protein [Kordiimonas lipolytica]
MNKFTMAGLSLSAALAFAPSAFAGDFSGLYGGIESSVDVSDQSVLVGGVIGYRMEPVPYVVVGVEGSYGSHVEGTRDIEGAVGDFGGEWDITGIAGIVFGDDDQNMVYGSIGYMNVSYETIGVVGSTSADDVRFGAGVEHQFSDLLSFRIGADYAKPAGEATYRIKAGLLVNF